MVSKPNNRRSHHEGEVNHSQGVRMPQVSKSFSLIFVLASSALSFGFGCLSRLFVLQEQTKLLVQLQDTLAQQGLLPSLPSVRAEKLKEKTVKALPQPKTKGNKEVPHASYTTKVMDTAASASARSMLLEIDKSRANPSNVKQLNQKVKTLNRANFSECYKSEDDASEEIDVAGHCQVSSLTAARYDGEDDPDASEGDEELHLPAGQHLLVDIKNVDGEFLNDESRLAQAMIDVVWESDLTLLSYHCHTLLPMGVTCVGVLLESHISFHTWPEQGVITLDLFTCGSGELLPVVPLIERLFAIPQVLDYDEAIEENEMGADAPVMVWSHKYRGFRDDSNEDSIPILSERKDFGKMISKMDLDLKKLIASVQTPFQRIDIYDVIDPRKRDLRSYRLSLMGTQGDTYESKYPEYFQPNRIVSLDGVMQSSLYGDAPYHEGLVHPGMFAHPNPKRSAIVGGGEGATLREMLRHDTIEHVKMIDIDKMMVNVSATYLNTWNDCSDIVGSALSCFDDPRADVLFEDALGYFIERFASRNKDPDTGLFKPETENEKFDVIVIDALDPQDDVDFAKFLYSNDEFTDSLFNALTEQGVLIIQLGMSPKLLNVPDELGKSRVRESLEQDLIRFGFQSLHQYDEGGCGFGDPWSYLVAFKDYSSRKYWYDSVAEVELKIKRRIRPTVSGKPLLKSFDGTTMARYQVPHSSFETVYCRSISPVPECKYLRGYEPTRPNADSSVFEIKPSSLHKTPNGFGVGLFTKNLVPKSSMIMQEKSSNSIHFSPSTLSLLMSAHKLGMKEYVKKVIDFVYNFGFENGLLGEISYDVSSSLLAYVNHGCDGTWNVIPDEDWNLTEHDVNPSNMTNNAQSIKYAKGPDASQRQAFNPVTARHMPHLIGGYDFAIRDIQPGEEILVNYLTSVGSAETWAEIVTELQEICGPNQA